MKNYDIVVIGGGPGGMNTAFLMRQQGKTVALIQDEQDSLGGVCLNRGCMPTKSLLKAATAYRYAKQGARYGLDFSLPPVDLSRLRAVTDEDLDKLRAAVQGMIDGAEISVFRGRGAFGSPHEVRVTKADGGTELIVGEQIVIATGSHPVELPFAPFDGEYILSSDQILQNKALPEKLLIIGGGAIGCEFATLYHTFGSEVILAEAQESLLPREDREAGQKLEESFAAQGIRVKTGTAIKKLAVGNGKVNVEYSNSNETDTVDKVLVGIGRRPNINGLNLAAAGVKTEGGAISVNAFMQTNVPHIYAVGDSIGGLMLAHAAEKEAAVLAHNMQSSNSLPLEESAVPRVAFCSPEVAAVGVNETTAGIGAFTMPIVPNGRSVVDKVEPAFVKLFVEKDSNVVSGAIIIGEAATEMIHEMALAVENRLTVGQIGNTVHVHPTHSKNIATAVRHFN
ncbi:dihydrolipoyl dehydrogenase [Geotalea uraniireducens]|uniref:Dihydrolipoyl dehydrogenase n=1 Tax=Geotalea uraniireducens TaxID=351604 RepID=A0ABN6VWN6_9BACT|nr:dihydrolipoyl dehydrogenase [Geotalea uraniireducens]BDV43611.1 dihydrolipoyl dehydrogenase [Geotalea uraniireducens]